jgi:hypothetical protein
MDQFKDFRRFVDKINHYGMQSGIIKIIPPKEWYASVRVNPSLCTFRPMPNPRFWADSAWLTFSQEGFITTVGRESKGYAN